MRNAPDEMPTFMTCRTNRCMILNHHVASHKLQRKVHAGRMHRIRIAYNNQLIITVRGIIITHDPRKLARTVIVVFHLISVPAIVVRVGPRAPHAGCVSRGRVIELVYLAVRSPAGAREESLIAAVPRGFGCDSSASRQCVSMLICGRRNHSLY